jgi:hypothetical protein
MGYPPVKRSTYQKGTQFVFNLIPTLFALRGTPEQWKEPIKTRTRIRVYTNGEAATQFRGEFIEDGVFPSKKLFSNPVPKLKEISFDEFYEKPKAE